MNITLEKKDVNNALLKVNLVEQDYEAKVNDKVKQYSKKANIKGFRPGKVPAQVIKNMMGESLIADEVYNILSESIKNYIKENNISIIGDPLPNAADEAKKIDWTKDKEFSFTYDLGIVPDFDIDLSNKIKVSKYVIDVDEKTLKETSENLRKQYGDFTKPESVGEGDFVYGKLIAKDGSFEKETMFPMNKISSKVIKNFLDKKIGDIITFDLKKAFRKEVSDIAHATGMTKEQAKNVKGDYTFEITEVSRSAKAALTPEFFDKVFGPGNVKTEEEYNAKLNEIVQRNYAQDSDQKVIFDIQDKIIEKTKISVPKEFFKRWLLTVNKEKLTEEKLNEDYHLYERELKWTLIRNKVSEKKSLKVEHEEVVAKAKAFVVAQYLQGMQVPPEMEPQVMEFVNKYLQEEDGKNYMRIYEDALNDKVLAAIKENATLKDKKVKVDEFQKIIAK